MALRLLINLPLATCPVLQFYNLPIKILNEPTATVLKPWVLILKESGGDFAKEVQKIEKKPYWDKKAYFIRDDATRENFFANNDDFNILHCSAHGYFAQNPLESGIVLNIPEHLMLKEGEELEYNLQKSQELQQSVITVNDLIKELNSEFELVFFSACVSGENKNEAGDELIGLSRGLFYAGTKAMILSLFNTFKNVTVDNKVAVKNFYKYWIEEQQPKAKAFQQYIKEVKKKEEYKHPFYWFAYILIGNPY